MRDETLCGTPVFSDLGLPRSIDEEFDISIP